MKLITTHTYGEVEEVTIIYFSTPGIREEAVLNINDGSMAASGFVYGELQEDPKFKRVPRNHRQATN